MVSIDKTTGLIRDENALIVCPASCPVIDTNEPFTEIDNVEYCEDGTVMRLYHHENEWKLATRRCIDARTSFWGSPRSFFDLFSDIFQWEHDLNCLDANLTYVFVLNHSENMYVIRHPTNHLVLVEILETATGLARDRVLPIGICSDIRLPRLVRDLREESFAHRGLIRKTAEGTCSKWDFDRYKAMVRLRGNPKKLTHRLIELVQANVLEDQTLFIHHYGFYGGQIDQLHETLDQIEQFVQFVYTLYQHTHIQHLYRMDETHPFLRTVKHLHSIYKQEGSKVSVDTVRMLITRIPTHVLISLLDKVEGGSAVMMVATEAVEASVSVSVSVGVKEVKEVEAAVVEGVKVVEAAVAEWVMMVVVVGDITGLLQNNRAKSISITCGMKMSYDRDCFIQGISIFDSSASTTTTGSLVTYGGITILATSDSSNLSSGGTFTTLGGMAINKTLYLGSGSIDTGSLATGFSLRVGGIPAFGITATQGTVYIPGTADASASATNASLYVAGGVSIGKSVFVATGLTAANLYATTSLNAPSATIL
ncbi:hypothetical protein HDU98_010957, partial [Podochytrium sp. JEL0797]